MRLDEEDIEAIALRVAHILSGARRDARPVRLLSAAELADVLGVSRSWIYHHARELGGVRLGDAGPGRRASLRFDLAHVRRYLESSGRPAPHTAGASARPRRINQAPPIVELIDYDGAA